jgi:hypothetical protein
MIVLFITTAVRTSNLTQYSYVHRTGIMQKGVETGFLDADEEISTKADESKRKR